MKKKRILIISNCAASKSESNGRIHMTHFANCSEKYEIHNFYLRGNPDIEYVSYFSFRIKEVLKSFLTLGIYKPRAVSNLIISDDQARTISSKSSKPIFHFVRNIFFGSCIPIRKKIINYILKNQIDYVVIWGCNVPFLYKISYLASRKASIPLFTITSEDYPLKKYNYISKKHSLFFKLFQSSLRKWCLKVYQRASVNIYTNDDLKNLYEEQTKTTNSKVIFFGSNLKPLTPSNNSTFKSIFYGGNLYKDRVDSIIEVADFLNGHNDITINLFGRIKEEDLLRIKNHKNISYKGVVSYEELICEMSNANVLLHVEGFSNDYIFDCRYAFSTKISDYIMSNKPLLIYGPKEISGIRFCLRNLPQFTATSKDQLNILFLLLNLRCNNLNMNELFSCDKVSTVVYELFK